MPNRVPTYRRPGLPGTRAEADRDYNRNRRDSFLAELYGTSRWKKFRAYIKRTRVLCEWQCKTGGLTTIGHTCHHIVDPRDDFSLAFDESNVLLVCQACHNRIHAKR